jgi:hypothetical protein
MAEHEDQWIINVEIKNNIIVHQAVLDGQDVANAMRMGGWKLPRNGHQEWELAKGLFEHAITRGDPISRLSQKWLERIGFRPRDPVLQGDAWIHNYGYRDGRTVLQADWDPRYFVVGENRQATTMHGDLTMFQGRLGVWVVRPGEGSDGLYYTMEDEEGDGDDDEVL